jgi:serine/threonine-protein kinase
LIAMTERTTDVLAPSAGSGPDRELLAIGSPVGSWRITSLIAAGGCGVVYAARHAVLERVAAVKVLHSALAASPVMVDRFVREARAVNHIKHPNIIDIFDFGALPDGRPFFVMELLEPGDLQQRIDASGRLTIAEVVAIMTPVCHALDAAHRAGYIHRDLKARNIGFAIAGDGRELVKLLDFGVAKLVNRDDEDVGFQTAAGSVIGTPAYMSPEQAGGMLVDARSDIYSLGAIMYELFCGQPMFRGRSFGEYVRKHLTEMPVPPHATPGGGGIDPELEALILRSLDKDPEQRFAHISELRDALLHLLGGADGRLDHGGTYPPQLAAPGATGPRALPVMLPALQPVPNTQHSQVSGASGASGVVVGQASGGYLPPLTLSGEYSLPPPPRPRAAAPWWLWFAGSGAAVGIGITAAVWYAGRADPSLAPRPPPIAAAPTAAAAPPAPDSPPVAAPAARPALVEVRFDSLPSGSVFADGGAAELCRTPCTFDIDLSDGGPADRRAFIVRRAGYVDSPVTVDLTGTQREFQVMLQHAAVDLASPAAEAHPREPRGDAKEPERRPARRPARPARKDARDGAARAPAEPRPEARPSAEPSSPPEPPEVKSPTTAPAIDPADTLDPFRKK